MPRSELLGVLKRRGARLTVLLTECCSNVVYGLTTRARPFPSPNNEGLFRDLFLMPEDVVDITSSSFSWDLRTGRMTGEFSWVTGEDGGLFTKAFHSILTPDKPKTALGWDPNKRATWGQFFDVLKARTNGNFVAFKQRRLGNPWAPPALTSDEVNWLRDQQGQNPLWYKLPQSPP
jgi:hypothetical protein